MIYLYYPFNDGTGMDTLDGLVRGVGNRVSPTTAIQSPAIGELYCDNGSTPGGLWNVGDNDEIYIIGHSYSGFKVLGDANKNTIDQSEIVSRLERCGLSKNVNCKIVMYACYSARTLDSRPGLAAFVASSLKVNEFSCFNNVYGYTKPVRIAAKKGHDGQFHLMLEASKGYWVSIASVDWAFEHVEPHVA